MEVLKGILLLVGVFVGFALFVGIMLLLFWGIALAVTWFVVTLETSGTPEEMQLIIIAMILGGLGGLYLVLGGAG
jgi:hypothetical protein